MKNKRFLSTSLATMALALSACGSAAPAMDDADANANADVDVNMDGSMDIRTNEGVATVGKNEVPADWPADVSVYPSATVVSTATMNPQEGKSAKLLVLTTTDSAQAVMDHYKTNLQSEGWKIEVDATMGQTMILSAAKGTQVTAMQITESEGKTLINLTVGDR